MLLVMEKDFSRIIDMGKNSKEKAWDKTKDNLDSIIKICALEESQYSVWLIKEGRAESFIQGNPHINHNDANECFFIPLNYDGLEVSFCVLNKKLREETVHRLKESPFFL